MLVLVSHMAIFVFLTILDAWQAKHSRPAHFLFLISRILVHRILARMREEHVKYRAENLHNLQAILFFE